MSSCSRACVHSAEIVYIALPSASSARTLRSGQATAAPVATRQALADRAAGEREPVVRGCARGRRREPQPGRIRLVGHDRPLGQQRADDRGRLLGGQLPAGQRGPLRGLRPAAGRQGRPARPGPPARRTRPRPARPACAPGSRPAPGSWASPGRRRRTPGPARLPGSAGWSRPAVPARTRPGKPGVPGRGRPAPRSSRAGNVSHSSRAPLAAAIRLAASSPGRRSAAPPSRITQAPRCAAARRGVLDHRPGDHGRRP